MDYSLDCRNSILRDIFYFIYLFIFSTWYETHSAVRWKGKSRVVQVQVVKHMGDWKYLTPLIRSIGATWSWLVIFTPLPLYPNEKEFSVSVEYKPGCAPEHF